MANFRQIDYQGPSQTYKVPIGDSSRGGESIFQGSSVGEGYFDIEYLHQLLNDLCVNSAMIYGKCGDILTDYALNIDVANTDLFSAQNMAYPAATAPGSITFDEYKYLLMNNANNATQYVLSAFEDSLRGPSGTNALDISTISLIINNEAKRVKEFIDGYIGDLDDTSEYRTVELFQDWAEDATNIIQGIWQALNGQITTRLSESELAEVTSETAPKFQALFQVKFNVINKLVRDNFGKLFKNWETTSNVFYSKNLGPALVFQLKVGRDLFKLGSSSNRLPILSNEISGTMIGLQSNFTVALADQLKRNNLFSNYCRDIIINISQRDVYIGYMEQLSQIGIPLKKIFTSAGSIEQVDEVFSIDPIMRIQPFPYNSSDSFMPSHGDLVDREDINAHPQYLLRSGGIDSTIYGDVFMAPGVLFDGMRPGLHRHTGTDGSEKISGANILAGTITDENIDTTSTTPIPYDLEVINQIPLTTPTGVASINVQVGFKIAESNVSGYEFEIIELG